MNISFKRLLVASTVLFSLIFLGVLSIQDIQAESVADEMRNKSQQCAAWANAGKVAFDKVHFCIISCRIDEELLTDENVQKCRKEYSSVKNKVAGITEPEIVILNPPSTIDEMVVDMNKAKQEYKVAVENAATSESKMQAQNCHDSCVRDVKRISRQGTSMHRAEAFWVRCTKCGDTEPKQYTYDGSRTLISNEKTKTTMSSMPDIEGVYLQSTRSGFRVRAEGREEWKTYCNEAARIKNGQDDFSRKVKPQDRIRLVGVTYDASKANKVVSRCLAESVVIIGSSKE